MAYLVKDYFKYLKENKNLSTNTLQSYKKDVEQYIKYMQDIDCDVLKSTTKSIVVTYMLYLKRGAKKATTISRKLASIRSFYHYLLERNMIDKDPTACLEAPKVRRKKPEILTQSEIDNLLNQPECTNKRGLRDKAMLELICETGIRVSELTALNLQDINWDKKTITCENSYGKRELRVNSDTLECLNDYIKASHHDSSQSALFLNFYGRRMTRQGFWKIVKFYKNKAQIDKEITPHTLRHSFAVKLVKNGTNLEEIKFRLGHKDMTATNMYNKLVNN